MELSASQPPKKRLRNQKSEEDEDTDMDETKTRQEMEYNGFGFGGSVLFGTTFGFMRDGNPESGISLFSDRLLVDAKQGRTEEMSLKQYERMTEQRINPNNVLPLDASAYENIQSDNHFMIKVFSLKNLNMLVGTVGDLKYKEILLDTVNKDPEDFTFPMMKNFPSDIGSDLLKGAEHFFFTLAEKMRNFENMTADGIPNLLYVEKIRGKHYQYTAAELGETIKSEGLGDMIFALNGPIASFARQREGLPPNTKPGFFKLRPQDLGGGGRDFKLEELPGPVIAIGRSQQLIKGKFFERIHGTAFFVDFEKAVEVITMKATKTLKEGCNAQKGGHTIDDSLKGVVQSLVESRHVHSDSESIGSTSLDGISQHAQSTSLFTFDADFSAFDI